MDPTPPPIPSIHVTVSNGGWDAPTVVTLIVSGLALVAALGSIVFAWKMARNDDARLVDEQAPTFRMGMWWLDNKPYMDRFVTGRAPQVLNVWIELSSSDPIDGCAVRLLDNVGVLEVGGPDGEK